MGLQRVSTAADPSPPVNSAQTQIQNPIEFPQNATQFPDNGSLDTTKFPLNNATSITLNPKLYHHRLYFYRYCNQAVTQGVFSGDIRFQWNNKTLLSIPWAIVNGSQAVATFGNQLATIPIPGSNSIENGLELIINNNNLLANEGTVNLLMPFYFEGFYNSLVVDINSVIPNSAIGYRVWIGCLSF